MSEELKEIVKRVKTKLSHQLTEHIKEVGEDNTESIESFIQSYFDKEMRESIEEHRDEGETLTLIMMFDEVSKGNGVVQKVGDYYELNVSGGK